MGSLGGGRVHFNLHRDEFSSDCQTVWDGSLLECYKAVNFLFDHRMVENWNFGHFWKKFDTFWALGASKLVKKSFEKNWKNRKNDEIFFSLFLFLLCSIECIVFPRLDTMTIKPTLHPLYSQKIRQITSWKWCENLLKSSNTVWSMELSKL